MAVRVDKWLQVARVFKTRSQATRACQLGRVAVGGQRVKPHRPLAVGDRVEIEKGERTLILEVVELRDTPLPKAEAARVYVDHSPPPPDPDPLARLRRRPVGLRERGSGRPTKRDRRRIDRWRDE